MRARLALLTLAGAALRFFALGRQSYWYDEARSALLARSSFADLATGRDSDLGNPPLHALLLHAWSFLFGTGDVALRALSALVGTLTIPVFHAAARRLAGERDALWATALLACAPFHIYLAQENRTYALVVFLTLASTVALLRALEQPSPARWAGHAVLVFLSVYAHYFGAFVALAQLGYVVWRERRALGGALRSFMLAALLFGVWLPRLLEQMRTPGNLGRSAESWHLHLAATPLVFSVGTTLVWKDTAVPWRLAAGAAALAAFGLPLLYGLRVSKHALIKLWLLVPIVAPLLISLFLFPLYNVRYVVVASLPFTLLVAIGLGAMPRRLGAACAAVIAATVAVSLVSYFTGTFKHRWRDAVAAVERAAAPDDLLLFDSDSNELSYRRYATGPQPRLRLMPAPAGRLMAATRPGAPTLDVTDEVRARRRVWLVLSDAAPDAEAADLEGLGPGWRRAREEHFRGIDLFLMQRPGM